MQFIWDHLDTIRDVLAVGALVYITWLGARHGFPWVWAKAVSIFNSVKGETLGLVPRVEALEANVAALHTATGVVPVAPIPAKAAAVVANKVVAKVAPVATAA